MNRREYLDRLIDIREQALAINGNLIALLVPLEAQKQRNHMSQAWDASVSGAIGLLSELLNMEIQHVEQHHQPFGE